MSNRPSTLIDTRVIFRGDNIEQLAKLPDGCIELRRVLKPTGSFYYHCDWHASHYVKVMLDQILGENQFQNEIVWRRTNARTEKTQWPRIHDILFLCTGGRKGHTFHALTLPGEITKTPHTLITGPDGKKNNTGDLTGAGVTRGGKSGREGRGFNPSAFGRHWGYAHSQMNKWDKAGRPDIDAFEAAMTRTDRKKGFFVSFDFSSDALREIQAFFKKSGKIIVPLTVRDILEEQIAMKLA